MIGADPAVASSMSIPDKKLLDEMEQRLLAPPDCLPQCAQIPRLRLEVKQERLTLWSELHALHDVAVPLPVDIRHWLPDTILLDDMRPRALSRSDNGQLWLNVSKGVHTLIISVVLTQRDSILIPLPLKPHYVEQHLTGWSIDGINQHLADNQLQLTRISAKDTSASGTTANLEPGVLPPFVRLYRRLSLGLDWGMQNSIVRESPPGSPLVVEIPLLEGESVITEGLHVKNNKLLINMGPSVQHIDWQSVIDKQESLTLTALNQAAISESWSADISPIWHASIAGIPVIHHQNITQLGDHVESGRWLPSWRPWPGESVVLTLTRPQGVKGQTLTIDESRLQFSPGKRAMDATLELSVRSSQGGQHTLTVPDNATLQSVLINGQSQPIRQQGGKITLPIVPGSQQFNLQWRQPQGISTLFTTPRVDLGAPSVNASVDVTLAQDRWILFARGPVMGPAVLFWGVLIVIALIAGGLSRLSLTPLNFSQWFLLGIGLSQVSVEMSAVVVLWLLALGLRARIAPQDHKKWFNVYQVLLVIATIISLTLLFIAVQQGLLGRPDMQVVGNQSSGHVLHWYQDRTENLLPHAWTLTLPLMVYRLLMLLWALWLAFSLLKWLKWGWACYSHAGTWLDKPKKPKLKQAKKGRTKNKSAPAENESTATDNVAPQDKDPWIE